MNILLNSSAKALDWVKDNRQQLNQLKEEIKKEALNKGTYRKAINWISSQKPKLDKPDYLIYAVLEAYDHAKDELYDECLEREIK